MTQEEKDNLSRMLMYSEDDFYMGCAILREQVKEIDLDEAFPIVDSAYCIVRDRVLAEFRNEGKRKKDVIVYQRLDHLRRDLLEWYSLKRQGKV